MTYLDRSQIIEHYGVKGMKWGVRKDRTTGVSKKTSRSAKKDANEFAKAKMFYGEGAGNRRKLIKARVNQRSKDPEYKKAFDIHLENQNMDKRGQQARRTRARKDVQKTTAKTARGVKNLAMGTAAPVTVTAVAVYAASKNPTVRRVAKDAGSKAYSAARNANVTGIVKNALR